MDTQTSIVDPKNFVRLQELNDLLGVKEFRLTALRGILQHALNNISSYQRMRDLLNLESAKARALESKNLINELEPEVNALHTERDQIQKDINQAITLHALNTTREGKKYQKLKSRFALLEEELVDLIKGREAAWVEYEAFRRVSPEEHFGRGGFSSSRYDTRLQELKDKASSFTERIHVIKREMEILASTELKTAGEALSEVEKELLQREREKSSAV
jgi:hypothetical protein